MLRGSLAVVAAVFLAATTACAPEYATPERDVDIIGVDLEYFLETLDMYNPSSTQREAVVEAVHAGEMSYETIESLFLDYVGCLEDAGFVVSHVGPVERQEGFYEPDARIYLPDNISEEQAFDMDRQCMHRHYGSAMGVYLGQPSSLDSYLESFDVQRDAIIPCLADLGIEVEADATRLELLYAVSEASARFMDQPLCWQGSVFSEIHPPGVDPIEFYPPELQEQIRQLKEEQ